MIDDRYIDRVRVFGSSTAEIRYALTYADMHDPAWRQRIAPSGPASPRQGEPQAALASDPASPSEPAIPLHQAPASPRQGEPVEDPEATCQRCGHANARVWHAPSPLWNAVMRDRETGLDRWGIVCPTCFAELADEAGCLPSDRRWHFAPDGVDVAELWADRDGRVWDPATCLWVAEPSSEPET